MIPAFVVRALGAMAVAAAASLLVACGGGSGDSGGSASSGKTTTRAGDGAAAYVGLTKRAAVAKAEAAARPWRIGREDDEQFALTQDVVDDRVTFEIDGGKVTAATLG